MYTNAQYQARDDRPVDDQIVNLEITGPHAGG
jgi:hypothetical protein